MRYSGSRRYELRRGKSGVRRWHRRLPKSGKLTDYRSLRARMQDKQRQAKVVFPNTIEGRKMWKLKGRSETDLQNYDTLYRRAKRAQREYKASLAYKKKPRYDTIRGKTGLSGIEEHHLLEYVKQHVSDPEMIDIKSLIDPELSYRENKRILQEVVSPTMREAAYM